MNSHCPLVVEAFNAGSAHMLKRNIQQHERTKQQKEIGKHQQFESLEGNISPAALHPINQPN